MNGQGLRSQLERLDQQMYASIFWKREFLRRRNLELRVISRLLPRDAQIADVGASRGRYALYFRSVTGPRALIHMFEPDPDECESLRRLCTRYSNLWLHPFALSSTRGRGVLKTPVIDGNAVKPMSTLRADGVTGVGAHQEREVPLRRLDDVAPSLPRPLDFLKCDVEGHELSVLRGAVETLERHRPIVLMEIEWRHARDDFQATFDLLRRLGYTGVFFSLGRARPLSEFDRNAHQLDVLARGTVQRQPPEYVSDFLFTPEQPPVKRIAASTL